MKRRLKTLEKTMAVALLLDPHYLSETIEPHAHNRCRVRETMLSVLSGDCRRKTGHDGPHASFYWDRRLRALWTADWYYAVPFELRCHDE